MYVHMVINFSRLSTNQLGMVDIPAHGQLNKGGTMENRISSVRKRAGTFKLRTRKNLVEQPRIPEACFWKRKAQQQIQLRSLE